MVKNLLNSIFFHGQKKTPNNNIRKDYIRYPEKYQNRGFLKKTRSLVMLAIKEIQKTRPQKILLKTQNFVDSKTLQILGKVNKIIAKYRFQTLNKTSVNTAPIKRKNNIVLNTTLSIYYFLTSAMVKEYMSEFMFQLRYVKKYITVTV